MLLALIQDPSADRIAKQLDALVARMEQLAAKLEASKPEDAARLRKALTLLTSDKHAQALARGIADRLNQNRLGAAIDDSKLLLDILDEVLRALLDNDRADEIKRVDAMLARVRELIRSLGDAKTPDDVRRIRELTDELRAQVPYADAQGALERASDDLGRNDRDGGMEGLRDAEKALQRRRDELARSAEAERLRSIQEEIARLLADHNVVAAATIVLAADPVVSREVAALSDREASLRDRAIEAARLTDGAFACALESIADDFAAAATLLSDGELGARTQDLQKQITRALEELIQAFKDKRRAVASGNDSGDASTAPGPRVPDVVQLRLIRSMQKDLLERTRRFDAAFDTAYPMTDIDKALLRRLASQEGRLRELLADLIGE